MEKLIRFFLRQEVLVNLLFALFIVMGLFSVASIPVERFPNVQMGKVLITTIFPGASPTDVEALVTREIEEALEDLEYVEFIESSSRRARSSITVKFIDDTDYEALYDELRLKVLGVMNELPDEVNPPDFTVIDVKEWLPTVTVNLVGDRGNRALTLMGEELKLALKQVPGVEKVELQGEYEREYHIFVDPDALDRYGVTFDDVATALQAANISVPAGDFEDVSGEYMVVVDEKLRTRADVDSVVVRKDADGSFVTVGDLISDARVSYRDPTVISSVNGQDAVSLKVIKTDEGNALSIVPGVEAVVARFEKDLAAEGVHAVLTQDQRITINDSISTLGSNLLVGIGLVGIIIWTFMGLRNAVLTTIGIPFAFMVTIVFMHITGNSLNEITLFSFVLVSGIIVDDAIVVVENIYRRMQAGEPLLLAAQNGAAEVGWPVVSATCTTVAAFLPMLIMSGSTGEFFAQVPIAVSFALCASLFECLVTLPPHFASWPGKGGAEAHAHAHTDAKELAFMRGLRRFVDRLVDVCLNRRIIVLFLVLVAFVAAIGVLGVSVSGKAPLIRIKFFPDEYTQYWINTTGPMGTPTEVVDARLKSMAETVMAQGPGKARSATAAAGYTFSEDYQPVFGSSYGCIVVEMPVKEKQDFDDPQEHLNDVREMLEKKYGGDGWTVHVRAEKSGPPTGKDLTIRAVGPNPDSVERLAAHLMEYLRTESGIAEYLVNLDDDLGKPDRLYRFIVDKERAAEYGLTPSRVAALAGGVLDGRYLGTFRTVDEDIDLKLRVAPEALDSPEAALTLPVTQHASGPVRLVDVTRVDSSLEPGVINRYQNNRAITVTANLKPNTTTSTPVVVNAVRKHYETIKNDYPGAELSFSGEFESTQRSYTSLGYAFAIAILIIYMILATQFRSYFQPLIIISAVVFALIGVIFGKLITQSLFTVNSFIATVGVTGVVVNDSLVLLDFINREYRETGNRRKAIFHGIRVRLRPILLTTLTTSLGLLPMAIGFPSYSLVWGAMASTFVTGLATATLLTLFVVPVEWDLFMALVEKRKRHTTVI